MNKSILYNTLYYKLTDGSNEIIRTVLSARPTAKNQDRCSPGGTEPKAIHETSADNSNVPANSSS